MQRTCRYHPLSAQPLVLALCHLRFSPVRQMNRYTPAIQDAFRRTGFPIERAGKVHQVTFTASDSAPVQMVEQQRWEYRNREETWSVLVTEDSVILQTTAYTRFERFAERLQLAVNTVLTESEQAQFGVVHRVGLRYIDMVRPSAGKDFRFYLRPGLHGVPDEVFQPGRHLLHAESRGQTVVGGHPGTMIVRIVQNDQGHSLPPDLTAAAPQRSPRAGPGELLTLIDMDHYVEGTFDPDSERVVVSSDNQDENVATIKVRTRGRDPQSDLFRREAIMSTASSSRWSCLPEHSAWSIRLRYKSVATAPANAYSPTWVMGTMTPAFTGAHAMATAARATSSPDPKRCPHPGSCSE